MEFGHMLNHLKKYKKEYPDGLFAARRAKWDNIFYIFIGENESTECLKMSAGFDMYVFYYPQQEDMFADDWEVFNKQI